MKLSNLAANKFIWSWIATRLLECSVATSRRPSILSSMMWKALGGTNEDDNALLLPRPPPCLGGGCYPFASISVSTGGDSSSSSTCSSPGIRILLLRIVWELMEGVEVIRLMCYGVSTPFSWRVLIIRLGRTSFDLEVVFVASVMMLYKCAPMSM